MPKFSPNEEIGKFSTLVEKITTSKNLQKKKKFLQNCMNWNILQRELFSEKLEIFPLFQFFRKLRNFNYPGPKVCQFSDRLEKLEIFPVKSEELENLQKVEIFLIWKHRKIFQQIGKFSIQFSCFIGISSTLPT